MDENLKKQYMTIKLNARDRNNCKQAVLWCMENIAEGDWLWYGATGADMPETFTFTREEDAVQFSLTWG